MGRYSESARLSRRAFHGHALAGLSAAVAANCGWPEREVQADEPAGEAPVPIIDTHQHLWDLEKFRLAWLEGAPDLLRRNYLPEDYQAATQGHHVVKAVYMEVDVVPEQQVAEAEYVLDLCERKDSQTVAAILSGRPASEGFRGYIDRFRTNSHLKGIRQVLHGATPRGYCLQDSFVSSMRYLGEVGLSFDLCMRPTELSDAVELARKCPDTQFILDHCGNADVQAFLPASQRGDQPASHSVDEWRRDIEQLAACPNVACKISGIIARVPASGWSAGDLAPIVNHCLDSFGPERVVFGGDWPVCLLGAPLGSWITALRQIIADRSREEQQLLLHDNAIRIYRLAV